MDVHYLPPNRNFKPAKEYFLDIIIIFLSVSMGFYVNDIRLSYIEKAEANEYAQSLYDDLKADSAAIHRICIEKGWIELKFDSAENILATKDLRDYNEFIYYIERYLSKYTVFVSNDITFQQLHVTGKFSHIKNIKLFKQIAAYYTLCDQYSVIENKYVNQDKNDLKQIELTLFNSRDLTSLDNDNSTDFYKMVIRPPTILKPIIRDSYNLKLLYIKIDNSKKHMNTSKKILEQLKIDGTKIMEILKDDYHLH